MTQLTASVTLVTLVTGNSDDASSAVAVTTGTKVGPEMTEGNDFMIDRRLSSELSGSEKIAALLKARGFTFASFARERGFWPEQVKFAVYGTRRYPEIRDALAAALDLPRAEIDRLIDGDQSPAAIPA